MSRRLYLAGPDVFLPNAEEIGAIKRAAVNARGAIPLHPLDTVLETDPDHHPRPLIARAIFDANLALLERADAVLANLTPFCGPSGDAGTVWEVGYAFARGVPVFGYSNSAAPFTARMRQHVAAAGGGFIAEDFDLPSDNLMVHFALAGFFAHETGEDGRWRDLTAFEQALAAAVGAG